MSQTASETAGLTIKTALRNARLALMEAGVEAAGIEAKWMLEDVTGLDHAGLIAGSDDLLNPDDVTRLERYLAERRIGRPIGRVLGWSEFYGRRFDVNDHTLDPRADTETLIDVVLERFARAGQFRFADIGTGTGAIGITIACECPEAEGVLTDISSAALDQAHFNAERHDVLGRLTLLDGDLCAPLAGNFDLIVSNPPYIASHVIEGLDDAVKGHDPMLALDGGADGLDVYRRLVAQAPAQLAQDGLLIVEIGFDQAEAVKQLLDASSALKFVALVHDLGANPRVVVAQNVGGFANSANMV